MLGYNYSTWITTVAVLLQYDKTIVDPTSATPSSNSNFNVFYPRAIEYAEQRIYRELQLLMTNVTDTAAATANKRNFTLPVSKGIFVVTSHLAMIIGGIRQPPMLPMAKEAIESLYPSDTPVTTPSIPTMWAPVDQFSVLLAPPPDAAYDVEAFGTQRPQPLSSTNTATFLTTHLPDLFLAATMISWAGYQRDYGMQADNPQNAQSWETQYGVLKASASVEELQKEFRAQAWNARLPTSLATPPPSG